MLSISFQQERFHGAMEKSQRLQKTIAEHDKEIMKSVTDSIQKVNKTLVTTFAKLQETVKYIDVYSSQSIQDDIDLMTELSRSTITQAAGMQFQIQSWLLTYYWDFDSMSILDRRIGENGAVIYLLEEFVNRCVNMEMANVTTNDTGSTDVSGSLTEISGINSESDAANQREQTAMTSYMTSSQEVTSSPSQKGSHDIASSQEMMTSSEMTSASMQSASTVSPAEMASGTTEPYKPSSNNLSSGMSPIDTNISQPNQTSNDPPDSQNVNSDSPSSDPSADPTNSMTSKVLVYCFFVFFL